MEYGIPDEASTPVASTEVAKPGAQAYVTATATAVPAGNSHTTAAASERGERTDDAAVSAHAQEQEQERPGPVTKPQPVFGRAHEETIARVDTHLSEAQAATQAPKPRTSERPVSPDYSDDAAQARARAQAQAQAQGVALPISKGERARSETDVAMRPARAAPKPRERGRPHTIHGVYRKLSPTRQVLSLARSCFNACILLPVASAHALSVCLCVSE